MKKRLCFVTCIVAFLWISPSFAAVYQWTDSNGVVHFSGQPDNQNAKPVEVNVPPPVSTPPPVRPPVSKPATDTTAAKPTPEELAATQEEQQHIDKICAQYQANLKLLQESGRRLYTVDKQGQYHYFSDAERLQQIDEINGNVAKYCAPAAAPAK